MSFILEGSVRKAGSRVRVNGQLIDGKNGGHVWADRYDRDLTDIFAIQDEITHAIVEQLKVKLLPQRKNPSRRRRQPTSKPTPYYLRGRQFIQRHSKSNYQLARRMFANAVGLDPLYARAYAGIADCDSFLFLHYHLEAGIKTYFGHAAKALGLDDGLAEAHASRGLALSLGRDTRRRRRNLNGQSRSTQIPSKAHYFYAGPASRRGSWNGRPRFLSGRQKTNQTIIKALMPADSDLSVIGPAEREESAARRGIERAKMSSPFTRKTEASLSRRHCTHRGW